MFADLNLGFVGEETFGSAMFTDEIFKGVGPLGFTFHSIGNSLGAWFA
jgi:hypothetical protein